MSEKKSYESVLLCYGIQIRRKNGTVFLASNVGEYVAMFRVRSDALRFVKELREELPNAKRRIRVVKLRTTFQWTA